MSHYVYFSFFLICYFFFVFFLIFYYVCIWLHWVSVAMHQLSLAVASRGSSLSQCTDFSLQWFLLLWDTGSGCIGFSACDAWPQQLWLTGPGACGLRQLWCSGLVASHYVYHVQFYPFQSLDRTPNSNANVPQERPSVPGDLVKVGLLPRDSVIPILKYLPQFNNKSGVISNGFKVFIQIVEAYLLHSRGTKETKNLHA